MNHQNESAPQQAGVSRRRFFTASGLALGAVGLPEFDEYRAAAKRVADSFHATFVPFQSMFDEAVKYAPPAHWAGDGVHPTSAGASLMAHNWLRVVGGK